MNLLRVITTFAFLASLANAVKVTIEPDHFRRNLRMFMKYFKTISGVATDEIAHATVGYIDLGESVTFEIHPCTPGTLQALQGDCIKVGGTFTQTAQQPDSPEYDGMYFHYGHGTKTKTFYGTKQPEGELRKIEPNKPVTFRGLDRITQRKKPYLLIKYFSRVEVEETLKTFYNEHEKYFQRDYGKYVTFPPNSGGSYIAFIHDKTEGTRKFIPNWFKGEPERIISKAEEHLYRVQDFRGVEIPAGSPNDEVTVHVQDAIVSPALKYRYDKREKRYVPKVNASALFIGMKDIFGVIYEDPPAPLWLVRHDWKNLTTPLINKGHHLDKVDFLRIIVENVKFLENVGEREEQQLACLIQGHVLIVKTDGTTSSVHFPDGKGYFKILEWSNVQDFINERITIPVERFIRGPEIRIRARKVKLVMPGERTLDSFTITENHLVYLVSGITNNYGIGTYHERNE